MQEKSVVVYCTCTHDWSMYSTGKGTNPVNLFDGHIPIYDNLIDILFNLSLETIFFIFQF